MPQKFQCSTCKADLIVLRLDIGKFAECPKCREWNEVPEILEHTEDSLNCKIKKKEHIGEIISNKLKQEKIEAENIQAENDILIEENEETEEEEEEKQEEELKHTEKQESFFPDSATQSPQDNIYISMDSVKTEGIMTFRDYLKKITPRLYATPLFIIINTLVFLLMSFSGVSLLTPELEELIPWGIKYCPLILNNNEWWRLFTCMFVHIGIIHFIINMVVLWLIGSITERSYGSIAFFLIYLVSGLAGSVASLFFNAIGASAGASGAITGTIGALIPFMTNKDLALPRSLTQRTVILTLLISGMALVFGLLVKYIDNAGHIGGLLAGIGTGFILRRPLPPRNEEARRKKYLGVIGIGVLILIVGITGGNLFLKKVIPVLQIEEHWRKEEFEKALGVLNEHPGLLSEIPERKKIEAVIYGNAGWENYLKGDFQRCIDLSEKACEIDPVAALYTRYNIALCYLRLDYIEKSRNLYTELENAEIKLDVENRKNAIQDLKDLIKQGIRASEARKILIEIFELEKGEI